jgi:hypothetical protein
LLSIDALKHVVLVPIICGKEYVLECPSSKIKTFQLPIDVKTILKNNDSVIIQRIFGWHFNIHRNDSVPKRNTAPLWVRNFKETSSVAKRKPPKRVPSLITPDDIEQERQAFVTNPRRSASRNTKKILRTCNRVVCRILHEDLNFHPHKIVMGQAINYQDTVYRKIP